MANPLYPPELLHPKAQEPPPDGGHYLIRGRPRDKPIWCPNGYRPPWSPGNEYFRPPNIIGFGPQDPAWAPWRTVDWDNSKSRTFATPSHWTVGWEEDYQIQDAIQNMDTSRGISVKLALDASERQTRVILEMCEVFRVWAQPLLGLRFNATQNYTIERLEMSLHELILSNSAYCPVQGIAGQKLAYVTFKHSILSDMNKRYWGSPRVRRQAIVTFDHRPLRPGEYHKKLVLK